MRFLTADYLFPLYKNPIKEGVLQISDFGEVITIFENRAVIPKENPNILTIDRSLFLNSTKRVSIFSNKTTHQIRLKITGNELIISAEDLDYSNKAEERLICNYNGDDMQICFNSRFLTEMLSNLSSDEVKLELSLPNRAGILTPTKSGSDDEKITMLVMPVMLNN